MDLRGSIIQAPLPAGNSEQERRNEELFEQLRCQIQFKNTGKGERGSVILSPLRLPGCSDARKAEERLFLTGKMVWFSPLTGRRDINLYFPIHYSFLFIIIHFYSYFSLDIIHKNTKYL